jgi:hypothetical protein
MVETKNSTGLGEFSAWSAGSNDKVTHPSPYFLKVLILVALEVGRGQRI